ncbi:MAG TPA: endonuclease V, partial [Defluviitoga tunisiensis]|nr:endonuclease V [Defluviitoga tunisiensis]HOL86813.1 endonuclease V [Defluviitoga tunisiensis]
QANKAIAVITTFDYRSLSLIDVTWATDFVKTSYIPGFLAFRELPIFLKAWEKLQIEPEIVFFDGQGYAHPRRMGLATHASFFIEKPTIGIAKSKLIGDYVEPGYKKGDYSFLYHKNEKIGIVLRTKDKVKPIFISPGNWIDFRDSLEYTLNFCTKYRIPEITRQAHLYTQNLKERGPL